MGWNSQPTTLVVMEDVLVSKENLLGKRGSGFKYAMMGLNGGRVNIGSCSLGGAQFVFDKVNKFYKIKLNYRLKNM